MSNTTKHQIDYRPIGSVYPNPRNAKKHSDKQISQVAASIERFGNLKPIVIDRDGKIIAGHCRWLAAKKLGAKTIPCIVADFESDQDKRAFALADNRLAELSVWDEDIQKAELEELFDSDYDISITGFTTADLDFAVVESTDSKEPEDVELPDPATDAVTRLGDKWIIGPHRLICGDARDVAVWERLLEGHLVRFLFGDLPYNLVVDGFVSGNGRNRHREFAMASGEMSPPEFTAFMRDIFRNGARFSTSGSIHYHCMDYRHIREILDAADGVYSEFKQLIVWDKGVGGQSAFYRSQHELIFVFKSGKGKHVNNFKLGETGRYRTNVQRYAGCNTFRKGRDADLAAHATVKPTALIADLILDCSDRGDLVMDPTVGSGSTLLAAHKTGRRAAAIEIDPLYIDTALRRLSAASGLTPILADDGRSFEEVAAARATEKEG